MICELEHKIFTIEDTESEGLALALFQFQYSHNPVYQQYVRLLDIDPLTVNSITEIPFLPIDFFKTHRIITTSFQPGAIFESSGTTQTTPSRHFVKELSLYKISFQKAFENFYGPLQDWCILGLLPGYLERQNSSLVLMVHDLIINSQHPQSGFYLYEHEKLFGSLQQLEKQKQKTILIGVSFALLDFAEKYPQPLQHTIVMETGGMKGRREEMTRSQLHECLKGAWGLPTIHSEYGMTELLSQAYSREDGIFESPPWMKVMLREEDDPLMIKNNGRGLINVIDMANVYSCSFIATDDIGLVHPNGSFEVLGRRDHSDLRGCSLMA
ncbi:MAG: acyl transferase [Chitinophagaceae bacterium]|nr:acyl transferase [Chitinophagaceae bacterium]